ncbi:MAG: zinc-dependent alcohol dehydrogenase [Acidimicrobiales bacterium]
MNALVTTGRGDAVVRDWAAPTPHADEIAVRPLLAGMCGTDLELIDGSIDPAYVQYPLVLGHEWVGQLVSDVEGTGMAGRRVVVEGIIPCGECAACRRGATNLCATYDEIGFTRPGAIAELITAPRALIHPLDDAVTLEDAVLAEPMAVVWRALQRLPLRDGLSVAVIGDGTIALLAAYLATTLSPADVTIVGRREAQRPLAQRTGATNFVLETPTTHFDLVIEAAGTVASVRTALECCARGGSVILLGLPPHGSRVEVSPADLVNNDVIVQASFSYTRDAFADVVQHLNAQQWQPSFLLTHRYPLASAAAAVAALRRNDPDAPRGKVVVDITP